MNAHTGHFSADGSRSGRRPAGIPAVALKGRRIGAGRNWTALFLALSLAFLCAGCGGAAGEAPEQTPAETQTPDSPSADVRAEAAGEQIDETEGTDIKKR